MHTKDGSQFLGFHAGADCSQKNAAADGSQWGQLPSLLLSSIVLGIGSWSCLTWHPELRIRVVQKKASIALAIAGGIYLGLALSTFQKTPTIAGLFDIPDLSIHYVVELAVNPLMLSNLGYLSGCPNSSMLMTILFSELSSTLLLATTLHKFNKMKSWLLLGAGVGLMVFTGIRLNNMKAWASTMLNMQRVGVSLDLLLFSWMLYPMHDILTMAGLLCTDAALQYLIVLDALSKLGVCHLYIKSKKAIENARDQFSQAEAD